MELQILDVDYVMVGERPVIRIFGKNSKGESVCCFYEGYKPYFYARGSGIEKMLEKEPQVISVEKVKRGLVGGYGEPVEVYKITLRDPSKTPDVRDKLSAAGATPYEADILFKYRFMNDFGLSGLGWVKAVNGNWASTEVVRADRKISAEKIQPVENGEDVPLKIMSLDIECVSVEGGTLPQPGKDPVVIVSLKFNTPYKGADSMILSTRSGSGVTAFPDEKAMLGGLAEIINNFDCDVITGFNINDFDLPYLLERMRKNGIRPIFGRCNQKQVVARKLMNRHRVSITGRVIVDSFEIVKKDFSLQRYGLDFVAKDLLGKSKEKVKLSQIEKMWKGGQEDFEKLVSYARKDAELAMDLVLELNLMDKYAALSKVSGTLPQDTMEGGETSRIENYILREFNREGYILPCRPGDAEVRKREGSRREELKGGFVIEPKKGLQSFVMAFDFKSMYPSIIKTFNICPTTLTKKEVPNVIKTPSGAMFVPESMRKGIIPKIVDQLIRSREVVKTELEKTRSPGRERPLYAKQWALKIMANAFYGHFGYSRARVYNLDVANAITSSGRDIIQSTKKLIEEKFGYEVVYGDTDSLLVQSPTEDLKEIDAIGMKISKHITEHLPGVIELEFEKVFKRFLPLTKKRYVAWKLERSADGWKESTEMKGIETVRRDWCQLTSETMEKVIETVLKKDDMKEAVEYFKHVISDLLKGEIPMQKLVITKTITKRPESYMGIQPHVELVKKLQKRNPAEAPGVGDRIGYVIVKGTQSLSRRTEDPVYVVEKGLDIDSSYYIENQLMPPLERIFNSIGVSKSELLGRGKQIGIMEAIKNHRVKEEEVVKAAKPAEVPAEQVQGLVCSRCGKFYEKPPLTGTCECGGSFEFSSQGEAVKYVTF